MLLFSMARGQSLDQGRQLAGGLKPPPLTLLHDDPRKPPRLWLVSVLPEDPSQLSLTPTVHCLGSRERLPQIHPHVERTIPLETEPAVRFIKLWRADTQIQQHPVATRWRYPFRHFRKIPAPDLESSGESRFFQ